jgi:hypothetical protein
MRSQFRLDLLEAVSRGMVGGAAYGELADELVAKITNAKSG